METLRFKNWLEQMAPPPNPMGPTPPSKTATAMKDAIVKAAKQPNVSATDAVKQTVEKAAVDPTTTPDDMSDMATTLDKINQKSGGKPARGMMKKK